MRDALAGPYLSQDNAAALLCLSPRTLESFRVEGRGPAFLKLGRRCVYARKDLEAWAEQQRRTSTAKPVSPISPAAA